MSPVNPKVNSVHINPKFASASLSNPTSKKVIVNPNFSSGGVHINPNFTGRALPPLPPGSSSASEVHINPKKFSIDAYKTKEYEEAIKNAVDSKKVVVLVNPKFQKQQQQQQKHMYVDPNALTKLDGSSPGSEKENNPSVPSTATKRISSFKKIGNKKLIRIRRKSKSVAVNEEAVVSSHSFKKIGTRKLIRMKSSKKKDDLDDDSSMSTPKTLVYKVKTSKKIIKTTPLKTKKPSFSSKFMTPLSSRKIRKNTPTSSSKKLRRTPFSKILNPFKIDRRRESSKKVTVKKPTSPSPQQKKISEQQKTKTSSPQKHKLIGDDVYAVTTTTIKKVPPPPKPARQTAPTPLKTNNLINVQGVKYSVSDNGRKLCRVDQPTEEKASNFGLARKLFLEGEEYIEDEPGVLIRSRNSMTRQSITSYRNRSINTIIKSQTRSKQYCMFYNKFGKCNKRDKGVCPYIHDAEKVAVCRKFLHGTCVKDNCLLSHKVAPEKMPSCKFFLEGLCTRDKCQYRHVNVNVNAEICPEFLKGFCSAGSDCKKRHVNLCPDFSRDGTCPKGSKCHYPHQLKPEEKTPKSLKKVPPAKPKRKSLGATPSTSVQEKKARLRYYDAEEEKKKEAILFGTCEMGKQVSSSSTSSSEYEARRQRILKKVEAAKMGWTGVAKVEKNIVDLDDSGPYEEIDEDEIRAPVGELPSFISLSKYASSDEDQGEAEDKSYEERLI